MCVRIHVPEALATGRTFALPPGPSRHVQVLRLQPGDGLTLFDGGGGEWSATIARMGRQVVEVLVGEYSPVERELACAVSLALAMPANDRMDDLVEKATELGVARIQPLVSERSVLRLSGERADRKRAHWQGVAAAACEQSGRTRLPRIEPVRRLTDWLAALAPPAAHERRLVLSLRMPQPVARFAWPVAACWCLSGPEGGLSTAEEALAAGQGFEAASLGPRTLRADTAPLALLAWIALHTEG